MRRHLILCGFGLCLVASAQPALAQNVLVLPKQETTPQTKPDSPPPLNEEKKSPTTKPDTGAFWNNLFPAPKPPPKSGTQQNQRAPTMPPIVTPPTKGKDTKKVDIPPLPKEVEESAANNRAQINGILDSLRNPPTQVFEQPEYLPSPDKDDRTFENPLNVTIESLKFREDDLNNAAAGTPYTAKDILENCQPRITGAVVGQNNSAELLDVRGHKGTGKTGYKGKIQNIPFALGLGCKLGGPPKNKGITIKMGEYYVFGVAQGTCLPPDIQTPSSLSISYEEGTFNCKYK